VKEIKAIIQPFRLDAVLDALHGIEGAPGAIVSEARGLSVAPGHYEQVVRTKLEMIVPDGLVEVIVSALQQAAHTGNAGDGRIAVIPIDYTVAIRTGTKEGAG
jgi:nitrogen regulatory protein P-II 1